jgi:ubiquinone/menaquinone biosynthesis methyltransferase
VSRLETALATPEGKRQYVRALFHTIADRYDLITVLLSYGQDRRWKAQLVRKAAVRPGDRALDLAAGTGDIAVALAAHGARVTALDVTHRMLQLARVKAPALPCVTADMLALPLPDASVDLVTTGYGLRNVPALDGALREIARVLRPGGRFLSLDFERPTGRLLRGAYLTYLSVVGGTVGAVLHGDPDTYRYIPASLARYPGAAAVGEQLTAMGFEAVEVTPLMGGLMALHAAVRGPATRSS